MRFLMLTIVFLASSVSAIADEIQLRYFPKNTSIEKAADGLSRSRLVEIGSETINKLKSIRRGDSIVIQPFIDVSIKLTVSRVETTGNDGTKIVGTSQNDYRDKSFIVVSDSKIGGLVYFDGGILNIQSGRNNNDRNVEFYRYYWGDGERDDTSSYDVRGIDSVFDSRGCKRCITDIMKKPTDRKLKPDFVEIGVVALVTKRAYESNLNIVDYIRSDIESASEALFLADIKANFVLKAVGKLNYYNEKGKKLQTTLSELPNYETLQDYRKINQGDLVVLYREYPENTECGRGNYVYKASSATDERGYSVVSTRCWYSFSAAHEFGHNLGLRHSRWDLESTGENKAGNDQQNYNFGYTSMPINRYDIMAYGKQCRTKSKHPKKCSRLGYYSDPRVVFDGKYALGVSTSRKNPAYAAKWLSKNIIAVSKYR